MSGESARGQQDGLQLPLSQEKKTQHLVSGNNQSPVLPPPTTTQSVDSGIDFPVSGANKNMLAQLHVHVHVHVCIHMYIHAMCYVANYCVQFPVVFDITLTTTRRKRRMVAPHVHISIRDIPNRHYFVHSLRVDRVKTLARH